MSLFDDKDSGVSSFVSETVSNITSVGIEFSDAHAEKLKTLIEEDPKLSRRVTELNKLYDQYNDILHSIKEATDKVINALIIIFNNYNGEETPTEYRERLAKLESLLKTVLKKYDEKDRITRKIKSFNLRSHS